VVLTLIKICIFDIFIELTTSVRCMMLMQGTHKPAASSAGQLVKKVGCGYQTWKQKAKIKPANTRIAAASGALALMPGPYCNHQTTSKNL
jgi:hypothetical protein